MKKISLLLFFFFNFSLHAFCQNTISGLEEKLKGATGDSLRIFLLISLAQEYQYTNTDKALDLSHRALDLANKKKLTWAQATAYHRIALLYYIQDNHDSAKKYHNLAFTIYDQQGNEKYMANQYNNLGEDYFYLGRYYKAYHYFMDSYKLSHKTNDSLSLATSLRNLSMIFIELRQYHRANDYIQLSQKYSDVIHDTDGKAYDDYLLGEIHFENNTYDLALYRLQSSLRISRSSTFKRSNFITQIFLKIANVYFAKNDLIKASAYYDSAGAQCDKLGNKIDKAYVNFGRGLIFIKEKKYNQALALIEPGMVIANKFNVWPLKIQCYENLAFIYEAQQNYSKALNIYKKYKVLDNNFHSQDLKTKLLHDQLSLESVAKDDQIQQLMKTETLQKREIKTEKLLRDILVVLIAITVLMLFSVYLSGRRRIRINNPLLKPQEELEKRCEELEHLNQVKDKFFSIISHDLRSPLHSLADILDLMDKGHITPEEFDQLNKELRLQFNRTSVLVNNLLDWSLLQMNKIKIVKERFNLNYLVDDNFNLLSSSDTKDIKLVNNVDPEIYGSDDLNIVNLILRNIISNGIKSTKGGGSVEVGARVEGNNVVVSVKDSGVGLDEEAKNMIFKKNYGLSMRGTANEKGTGFGLNLCKEFVEKNGGKIWVESTKGKGSTFYFTLEKA